MKRILATVVVLIATAGFGVAQGFEPEIVFSVELEADREPALIGDELRLAVMIDVDRGWHINSDDPGDEFSVPTTLAWRVPEGWATPRVEFPKGKMIKFEFSDEAYTIEYEEMTPSMKIRRHKIRDRYHERIAGMYGS